MEYSRLSVRGNKKRPGCGAHLKSYNEGDYGPEPEHPFLIARVPQTRLQCNTAVEKSKKQADERYLRLPRHSAFYRLLDMRYSHTERFQKFEG